MRESLGPNIHSMVSSFSRSERFVCRVTESPSITVTDSDSSVFVPDTPGKHNCFTDTTLTSENTFPSNHRVAAEKTNRHGIMKTIHNEPIKQDTCKKQHSLID